MSDFEPVYLESFAKDVEKLDSGIKKLIEKRLKKILQNPFLEKPLKGGEGFWSSRLMHFRIIYRVEGNKAYFLRVGHRKKIYAELRALFSAK